MNNLFKNFNLDKLLKDTNYKKELNLYGINVSFLAYLLSENIESLSKLLVIFPSEEEAKEFVFAFNTFCKEYTAEIYPELELLPFSEACTLSLEEMERLKLLWNLSDIKVLAGSITSFTRKNIPRSSLKSAYIYLIPGEKINRESFLKRLIELGYERTGMVKEKGCFTVKGGVIDVWSPNYQYPVRIDLFGEEIVSFKVFDPETQTSFNRIEELSIIPCKEVFFPENTEPIYKRLFEFKNRFPKEFFSKLLQEIENRALTENSEFLLPIFYKSLHSIFEEIPKSKTLIILYEPEKIRKNLNAFLEKLYVSAFKAKEKGKLTFDETFVYSSPEEIDNFLKEFKTIKVREVTFWERKSEKDMHFQVLKKEIFFEADGNRIEKGFKLLKESLNKGERVIFVVSDKKTEKIIKEGLRFRGLEEPKNLDFIEGYLKEGFFLPDLSLWITSEYELFGKFSFKKKGIKEGIKRVKSHFRKFEDLKPGNYVVHKLHGIGKYIGLSMLKVGDIEGEFLEIEYEGGDKLYLPVSRLDELYPYVGISDKEPKLDKLGKKTFLNRKNKIEKELREVVQELLSLYAERKALKSFALSFPTLAYQEFASTFPYEETPDQKRAIEEIIEDLCSEKPMERLLVGDVGFGKTEVALRAIFLVAYHGKQVAFLVPTTILAEQHYRNIKSRLEPFGIKVGVLSRLRSEKEQKNTIEKLAKGEIKVIIGTHRLLSSDVEFKDLGLLIIDEEHRFGVKQKEKIKQLRKNVKVLILSATPIPRSLQLSLLEIFDLSVIESPPPGRKPIKTILAKFDPEIIKYAIEKELQRGGQVFFVNPRIHGLAALARYVKKLVPQAKIEIIHGQMPRDLIEKNLYRFLNKKIDVLVCTPIIGSGIDIPSVNTIIINRADMFGLADIYQLRGRVGRAEEKAYAYLLVPSLKTISDEAQKRFKALLRFSELGSGFKLALSDLKIRGAGELLGIKQSGHINTIGYELYLELLENTIKALKGEKIEDWEPEVNIKLPAYIPQNYVPEAEERLSLYREFVLIKDKEDLLELKTFFEDKYGQIPEPVENLFKIYLLKLYMKELKIRSIEIKGKDLIFTVKDQALLLNFRKLRKKMNFLVKTEKSISRILFKPKENPLNSAIEICEELLN